VEPASFNWKRNAKNPPSYVPPVSTFQELEDNLPMDGKYKKKGVSAAPIRVIQLAYNSGVSFFALKALFRKSRKGLEDVESSLFEQDLCRQ
jgi:hypothetical protein